jgi:hypothetical protein
MTPNVRKESLMFLAVSISLGNLTIDEAEKLFDAVDEAILKDTIPFTKVRDIYAKLERLL